MTKTYHIDTKIYSELQNIEYDKCASVQSGLYPTPPFLRYIVYYED
jgi:hypothetical protein